MANSTSQRLGRLGQATVVGNRAKAIARVCQTGAPYGDAWVEPTAQRLTTTKMSVNAQVRTVVTDDHIRIR